MDRTSLVPHSGAARFLAACQGQQPDATPVWFMRQAGSCVAEYRALLKKYDVLTIAKTPELSSSVALMPIKTFGVDAAVLYADIMLPTEEMGIKLSISPEGPVIHTPVRSLEDVQRLRVPSSEEVTPFIMEGIRLIRRELEGKQAIIGIAGAPFTLACYLIEGGPSRDYRVAKALMYGQPAIWHALMEKITQTISGYLVAQINAGADVIQLFDSWVGALSPSVYRRFVLPYTRRVFEAVRQNGAPAIHFGTGTGALLETLAEAGGDVISVDWRVDLDEAWKRIGFERGIQGNLDPALMATSWPVIEEGMHDVLRRVANRPGHIFNFGHAVPKDADPDLLRRLVDAVHTATQR
ncbi:MAG: uroporphyrinogen decarboxylase [Ktedonobacteraceae bacterium]|nr:uroporphyrinogen decarboxylase [Ktedonobacteraceae bacterium]